jgi:hypothetical protein
MGGKGGVGKTSVMAGLAKWFDAHEIPVQLEHWVRNLGQPDADLEASLTAREAAFQKLFTRAAPPPAPPADPSASPAAGAGSRQAQSLALAPPAGVWETFFQEKDDFEPLRRLALAANRPLTPNDYFWRDRCLVQLEIMRSYVDLHECRPTWQPALEHHQAELKERVKTDLIRARWMLQEMQENIYLEDLLEALQPEGASGSRAVGVDAPRVVRIRGSQFANFLRKLHVPAFRADVAGYTVKAWFPDFQRFSLWIVTFESEAASRGCRGAY